MTPLSTSHVLMGLLASCTAQAMHQHNLPAHTSNKQVGAPLQHSSADGALSHQGLPASCAAQPLPLAQHESIHQQHAGSAKLTAQLCKHAFEHFGVLVALL